MSSKSQQFATRVLDAFLAAGHLTDKQVEEAGGPSSTWMTLIRKVSAGEKELARVRSDSLARIDKAAGWSEGSASLLWNEGVEPTAATVEATTASAINEAVNESRFLTLSRAAEEAQTEFETAVDQLVAAESKINAAQRRVFSFLALEAKLHERIREMEEERGRPLTQLERFSINSIERPTEREIVELLETHATHWPHEWTRYEMALVEAFEPNSYPDATLFSRFADMTEERKRMAEHAWNRDELAQRRDMSDPDVRLDVAADDVDPDDDETPGESR